MAMKKKPAKKMTMKATMKVGGKPKATKGAKDCAPSGSEYSLGKFGSGKVTDRGKK